MENCLIKPAEYVSKLNIFLFYYLGIKRIFKKNIIKEKDFFIVKIPFLFTMKEKRKQKYYEKLCNYFHKMNVKNVCAEQIDESLFLYHLRKEFYLCNGISVFYENFPNIITAFAEKKGFSLQVCEVVFISNYPNEIKKLIESTIHLVKGFSVYTKQAEHFVSLVDEMRASYGVFIGIKKEEKPKKYHKIYVNCEVTNILDENFFQSVLLLDIHGVYLGGYRDVIFSYKTKEDGILKEQKIKKNLSFTEFYKKIKQNEENMNEKQKKNHYKIVNIIK